ncbi:MAG: GAF domain-containing protein [Gaiellaceae bacterium]|jgi:PAS domain S-box-containing protein
MAVGATALIYRLAALPGAAVFGSVLEDVAVVLAAVLIAHLLLDLFVLRRRRARRELRRREQNMAAVAELSAALARAESNEEIARIVLDTLNDLTGFEYSGLMLIDEESGVARGLAARTGGEDVDWYPSARLDLKHEASGARRVYETRQHFVVTDMLSSADVNSQMARRMGLKSAVFLPLESERGIVGLVVAGSTSRIRRFEPEQLSLARMLAGESSLAFERARSVLALAQALERERLVAQISRQARSELDVDGVIEVALAETAKALGVSRCFLRLGEPSAATPLRAEWHQEGLAPVPADVTPFLSVSNLALRTLRTVAVADVEKDPELEDESLGGREVLLELGSRAVLATPIVLFDKVIGSLGVHASQPRRWSDGDIAFTEAIARELGIALHTAGLLEENEQRLEQQEQLLTAAETMTGELELDTVLAQRLASGRAGLISALGSQDVVAETVRQAVTLLDADAALLLELEGSELVAREGAGEGIESMLGRHFPAAISLAGDIVHSRRPLAINDLTREWERVEQLDPIVAPGFQALAGVPLIGPGDASDGVLLVYSRQPRAWRVREIEALEALAANTVAALANAELYLGVSLERERSFAILASVADGIVAVDREGKIVLWNAAVERITGLGGGEVLGRTIAEALQVELDWGGETGERPISIKRGGSELWLLVTEAIMRDPSEQVAGKIYTLRDVSADRLIEQAKSDFVSSVSHELRAPLTSIYGFAETLLRRGELFDEAQRHTFLSYIASESERLTGIVDALLDVAELDSGDLRVDLEKTDVGHVVREVVESASLGEGGSNGHDFVIDLPEEPLGAEADRDKLRRVLTNLVDNAIRFSPAGGTVTVAGQKHAGVVELRVADEGVGIPEQEKERIFRKFYRGSSSVMSGGTGLGLFITRGLVMAMGGRIWVDSVEGEGSTFVFELPAGDYLEQQE